MRKNQKGFTLVEMSIVLVVIGLITGGIMGGKSLIRAAQLRSIMEEYKYYSNAIQIFNERYQSYPGDMPDATNVWPVATFCPGTTAQGSTNGTTCNGDGDGRIETAAATANEAFRSWQHLANAGLIEGIYNGVTGPGHAQFHAVIGTNVPKSKFPDTGWTIWSLGVYAGAWDTFAMDYGNNMFFGKAITNSQTFGPALTPGELYNIDNKVDDGKPGYGKLIALYWDTCTAAANFSDIGAAYLLSETGETCSFTVRSMFN